MACGKLNRSTARPFWRSYLIYHYLTNYHMDSKQILGLILTISGMAGLGYGVFSLFTGGVTNGLAWAAAILGLIFFSYGISLMRTVKSST